MTLNVWPVAAISDKFITADTPAEDEIVIIIRAFKGEMLSFSFCIKPEDAISDVTVLGEYQNWPDGDPPVFDVYHLLSRWRAGVVIKKAKEPVIVPDLLCKHPDFVWMDPSGSNAYQTDYTDADTLQAVNLEAGKTHQYWVDVTVPETCAAGVFIVALRIYSGTEQIGVQPVVVGVLPIELPKKPAHEFSISYRARIASKGERPTYDDPEIRTTANYYSDLKNLFKHGISNPICYEPRDCKGLALALGIRQSAGMTSDWKTPLYLKDLSCGVLGFDTALDKEKRKNEYLTALYKTSLLGRRNVYAFAADERQGTAITIQKPYWNMAHDCGLKLWAASWDVQDLYDNAGYIPDLVLLHCGINFNSRTQEKSIANNQRLIADWQANGTRCWFYDQGGMLMPETLRRRFGRYSRMMGFDGVCPYCYAEKRDDAWSDFKGNNVLVNHSLAFPGRTGPINTPRIKAINAAQTDMRIWAAMDERGIQPPLDVFDNDLWREQAIDLLMADRFFRKPKNSKKRKR